jgi:hypothetical protein
MDFARTMWVLSGYRAGAASGSGNKVGARFGVGEADDFQGGDTERRDWNVISRPADASA